MFQNLFWKREERKEVELPAKSPCQTKRLVISRKIIIFKTRGVFITLFVYHVLGQK